MLPVYRIPKGEPLPERILGRSQLAQEDVRQTVARIVSDVKARGDQAVFEYTKKFDRVEIGPETFLVSQEEIRAAYEKVPGEMLETMRLSRDNITAFHEKQMEKTWMDLKEGITLGQIIRPIENVGVYVPGGTAPLSSSVLMNVLPAKVAGAKNIVMATPPQKDGRVNPFVLVAAAECGVETIYKMGGAQAIAALSLGTKLVQKVDKVVGPGNIFVANAKREVFGIVGIDMIAGPSELLVIADESANARFVAADLLSQAEHLQGTVILVTTNEGLAAEANAELARQLPLLSTKEQAEKSLLDTGAILIVEDLAQAFDVSNQIAPEHLELCIQDAFSRLGLVKNAGACFVGHYSPEPLGDYFAGPNHVLPTSGTARFFSPLTVQDFIKRTSVICYDEEALRLAAPHIERFALAEELAAHAKAATIRFEKE